ncbi:MAG: response regulator [Bacteroidota bacterium]
MADQRAALRIVLIDDNHDHARILQWAFQQNGCNDRITYFDDGKSALDFLHSPACDEQGRPDLIFLDLNLPRIDGREVLRRLKGEQNTVGIPVIILSSSDREEDVRKAYELGASSYVSKSAILQEFGSVVKTFQDYWSTIAKLPSRK